MIFDEKIELEKLIFLSGAKGNGKPINEYTASGNPMSFQTNLARPLKSLSIHWTPSQAGTGDPSPQNVRSISGQSGVTIYQTGANLIDDEKRYKTGSAVYVGAENDGYHLPLKAGKYTFSAVFNNGKHPTASIREQNAGSPQTIWASTDTGVTSATFTLASDGVYRINFYLSGLTLADVGECWLNYGETASTYAPYTGTTIPVTFPAEVGTVYGGTLELSTGVLTVEQFGFDPQYYAPLLDTTNTSVTTGRYVFDRVGLPLPKTRNGVISNRFSTNIASGNPGRMSMLTTGELYWVVATSELVSADATGLAKWFVDHPTVFVYEMATPQTIQLTPTEITALVGENVIWSDTKGSNTAVYYKKG